MDALTKRQLEVTRLAAGGLTNAEIATELGIKPESVKSHLSGACRKMGARNRAHLVHLAHGAGLFEGTKAGVRSRDTTGSRAL